IRICPVGAITKSNGAEEQMIISEMQCLGYTCRECLRLVLLTRYKTKNHEQLKRNSFTLLEK
ncbi:MAG: hypothetical protein ACW991_06115, partial [Candidatus Hodarchaeales archaeon]